VQESVICFDYKGIYLENTIIFHSKHQSCLSDCFIHIFIVICCIWIFISFSTVPGFVLRSAWLVPPETCGWRVPGDANQASVLIPVSCHQSLSLYGSDVASFMCVYCQNSRSAVHSLKTQLCHSLEIIRNLLLFVSILFDLAVRMFLVTFIIAVCVSIV